MNTTEIHDTIQTMANDARIKAFKGTPSEDWAVEQAINLLMPRLRDEIKKAVRKHAGLV